MRLRRRKVEVIALFALVLATDTQSQQTAQLGVPEHAAVVAFEQPMRDEGGPHLKRVYTKHVQDFCAADARRWGDGIVGYERIAVVDERELAPKMLTLVRQWKTTGSQQPLFDPSEFPRLRRYALAECGVVDGQTKFAVAVYRSAWDTYWANWANLLGK